MTESGEPNELQTYLLVLFTSASASRFVEIRWSAGPGMHRQFVAAAALPTLERTIAALGQRTDVYVGVLPRWRHAGDRSSVARGARTVWVDLDLPDAQSMLQRFEPRPTMVVQSGGVGHVHAYWLLRRAVLPHVIEQANSRLAWALGGDLGCADAARILRPPSTLNLKREPRTVRIASVAPDRSVPLGTLMAGLPEPPRELRPKPRDEQPRLAGRDELLRVTPDLYVRALTGQTVGSSRKVHCPLHDDAKPSLHVYHEASRGWFCFGCRRGGTVYDLAAGMWGIEPRRAGFLALREGILQRLAA